MHHNSGRDPRRAVAVSAYEFRVIALFRIRFALVGPLADRTASLRLLIAFWRDSRSWVVVLWFRGNMIHVGMEFILMLFGQPTSASAPVPYVNDSFRSVRHIGALWLCVSVEPFNRRTCVIAQ